jgi:signal transduction histidine kinase
MAGTPAAIRAPGLVPGGPVSQRELWWTRLNQVLPHSRYLSQDEWERRHHAILVLLAIYFLGLAVFGLFREVGLQHLAVDLLAVLVPGLWAAQPFGGRKVRAGLATTALLTAAAIGVHLSGGAIEAHFQFFVIIPILMLYQDWLPFLLAVGYVVVEHGIVGVLLPASVYNHGAAVAHPWEWAGIHAAFVIAACAAYIALWRLGENDHERAKASEAALRVLNLDLEQRVAERTAQLEAKNKELEAFSYSVSHDLRAPLRAIDGFARILLEDHAEELEPEARKYLKTIDTNAAEMGKLIDDLLQFSRLGQQAIALQPVDPAVIARAVVGKLQPQTSGRTVDIRVEEMPECRADAALLQQVYLNLLSNAVKFTRNRAVAEIEAGSLAGEVPSVYYVRDNGAGFDMAYKEKLFAVFERLHRQTDYEGTGVGLAIVNRIISRHGGRIWAESEPDAGATFFFTLER